MKNNKIAEKIERLIFYFDNNMKVIVTNLEKDENVLSIIKKLNENNSFFMLGKSEIVNKSQIRFIEVRNE